MTRGRRPAPQQKPHFVWEGDAAATTQSAGSAEPPTAAVPATAADGQPAPGGRGARHLSGRILIGAAVLALLSGGLYALVSDTGTGGGGHDNALAAAHVSSVPSTASSTEPAVADTPTLEPSPSITASPTEKASASPTEAPQHVQTIYVTATQPAVATTSQAAVAPATHSSAPAVSGEVVGLNGMCLDDRSGGVSNGNPIQIFSCDSTNSQVWTVEADGTLRSSGMCMDVTGGNDVDGTLIDLYHCNGTGAQVWQSRSNGELYNPLSGKCLDDPGFDGSGTQL
jgi:Ricin-type beta-trefoil lectin domain